MKKTQFVVIITLMSLILALYPSSAQVAHENPASVKPKSSYDSDLQLALCLQAMFGSIDGFTGHINASDFNASRTDLILFQRSYANFNDIYQRSNMSGTDMEAIASKLEYMAGDLSDTLNSSEAYSLDLSQFNASMSASDRANASQIADRLQLSYRNLSESISGISTNASSIYKMLGNSSVDTSGLEHGIAGLNDYTSRVSENNKAPSSLASGTSLVLTAGKSEVISGDHILLTTFLRANNGTLFDRQISFYVDDYFAGTAITDRAGSCSLNYPVDGRSFNGMMLARADLDNRDGLPVASSNIVEITHRPERASLRAQISADTAGFGDIITVYGTLSTATGFPVANHTVNISLANILAGNTTTQVDGSFSFPLNITSAIPAGESCVSSSYDGSPGDMLMGTLPVNYNVVITPDTSLLTLDQPETAYHGGDSALFNGSLVSGSGRPAAGTNVSIYADDALIGTCTTDQNGSYGLETLIPYNITAGTHAVRASFDSGTGKALAGSNSGAFNVLFEPVTPMITATGVPLLAFPGDVLNISGIVMTADGRPLGNRQLDISFSGQPAGTVTTDAGGSYQLSHNLTNGAGLAALSISVAGDDLLSGKGYRAGSILVMPFDKSGMAVIAIIVMLIIGLVSLLAAGARRVIVRPDKKTLPKPVVSLPASGGRKPATIYSLNEEIGKIDSYLAGGGDRREAVLAIYLAARRMLYEKDPALPESATHREIYHMLSGKRPSLSEPLGIITNSYEDAVFGHVPPTAEEVASSLHSLNDLKTMLYGNRGFTR